MGMNSRTLFSTIFSKVINSGNIELAVESMDIIPSFSKALYLPSVQIRTFPQLRGSS